MDELTQRTDAWFAARLGKVTASRIADVMARTKTGWGCSRANYMAELIVERLTQQQANGYINAAMQWGIDHEDEAVAAYEFRTGNDTETVGFVDHPDIAMSGASPDRRIGDIGLLEVKCPNTATHIDTLLSGKVADKYVKQMQWQMMCDDRQWCDFVSFDPRLPERLQLFIKRVERDADVIAGMNRDVMQFLSELDTKLAKLDALETDNREAA